MTEQEQLESQIIRSLVCVPINPHAWRMNISRQLCKSGKTEAEFAELLGMSPEKLRSKLISHPQKDKDEYDVRLKECIQANMQAGFTLEDIARILNIDFDYLKELSEKP